MLLKSGDNMKREFVMMPVFDKAWKKMNLTDDDLQALQEMLLTNL